MSILPSLPSTASFNSVILPDEEWAHVCGVNAPSSNERTDDIYIAGDEELPLDSSSRDDWRRSAYMIVQVLRGESLL